VTGFSDLNVFTSIPRLASLRLAPDGSWLAATVQSVAGDPPGYVTSIWRIGTAPGAAPARLTRSAEGEAGPEFLPDGSLLFVSRRPAAPSGPDRAGARSQPPDAADPAPGEDSPGQAGAGPESTGQPAVWLLPAGGGEARRVAAPPGGIAGLATAVAAPAFACTAPVFAGATGARQDAGRRKARTEAGVNAILHESGQVRY
jgi:dipeptidyl aminopeptidase/acylaminoacyl peptidase